ncbi:MAG: hypothetical protein VX836_17445 [Pseudomonadota bacterium]|nr:hypothetical protein [Pseudomonadota bacterium]
MAVGALLRLAGRADAAVYPAIGGGAAARVARLAHAPRLRMVRSIREATVLLVAGELRAHDVRPLMRLHDQLPHPRATLCWGVEPGFLPGRAWALDAGADPLPLLHDIQQRLFRGELESEPDTLPDEPPAPWQGKGPHGQGGEGMMGGRPYGRPMPMMGEERRDGLMLDALKVSLGPFFPLLPPGLALEFELQGDVIQNARVLSPPWPDPEPGAGLRLAARLLELLGLPQLARRAAAGMAGDGSALLRRARRHGALLAIPPRLGGVRERLVCALSGTSASGEDAAPLVEQLPGLEWHEALLLINSYDSPALLRIAGLSVVAGAPAEAA